MLKSFLTLVFLSASFFATLGNAQPLEINDPELYSSEMGGGNHHSAINEWCRDRLSVLNFAHNEAMVSYQNGDYSRAIFVLHQGLVRASYNVLMPFQRTLTSKTISRGIQISQALQKSFGRNELEKKSIIVFLSEYYKLVNKVATTIDIPYYPPYDCRSNCYQNNILELENAVLEFVRSAVYMVLENLVTVGEQQGARIIYPLSHPKIFLSVLEVTLRYAVNDLSQGLYGHRFACTITDLNHTALRLKSYLTFRSVYQDDFHAVQSTYQEVQNAMGAMSCH